jgi:hypothetical protein
MTANLKDRDTLQELKTGTIGTIKPGCGRIPALQEEALFIKGSP